MSTARSMARGAVAMAVSQGVTWSATLTLTLYLPRALGAAGYGRLQFVLSLIGIFAIFIELGATTLITREVARDRSRAPAYLVHALLLQAITALAAFACLIGVVHLLHRPPEVVQLAWVLGGGMILFGATAFLNSFLRGFEQVHYQAWGSVLEKVLEAAIILALLSAGFGVLPIAWAMVGVGALHLLWTACWVWRLAQPRWSAPRADFLKEMLRESFPFFLFALFAQIYDKVDVAMLAVMASDTAVGWYSAAYRLFEALFFIPHIFGTVAFPVLSRLWKSNPEAYREAVHRSFRLLCAAAAAVCVPAVVLAGPVVDFLYSGSEFSGTAPALRILAIGLACMYVNTLFVMVLQTTDRQAAWVKAGAAAALLNPVLNYFLIPGFGHLGAAGATVATEVILAGAALRACPPGLFGRADAAVLGRTLLAAGVLTAGLWLGLRWGMVPALLAGLPLYALSAARLGLATPADLAPFRTGVWKRRQKPVRNRNHNS